MSNVIKQCNESILIDTFTKAACSYARDTFYIYIFGTGTLFVPVCDTNGDNAVDFDEFFDKLKFYITTAFEVLDENEDGSILDEATDSNIFNSISYQFFEALLNEVFEFFDSNKDGALSVEDDFSEWFDLRREQMDERVTTFNDALDRYLISLPAPIYNLYAKVNNFNNHNILIFNHFSWTETLTRD